jgi:hypothetical protein
MVPHSIPGCPNNRVWSNGQLSTGPYQKTERASNDGQLYPALPNNRRAKASVPHATKRGTLQGMIVKTIRPC